MNKNILPKIKVKKEYDAIKSEYMKAYNKRQEIIKNPSKYSQPQIMINKWNLEDLERKRRRKQVEYLEFC